MIEPTSDDPNMEETIQQLVVSQGGFFVREVKKPDDLCAASAAPTQPRIMRLATIEEIRKHLAPLLAVYEKPNKGGEKATEYIVTKKENVANGGAFLDFDIPVAKFYDANELNKFMEAVDDGTYWVEEVNNNNEYAGEE